MHTMERTLRASTSSLGRLVGWALLALSSAALAYDTPRINTLYHYTLDDYGSGGNLEVASLIEASNGDLYGVSATGANGGFVYRVSRATGVITHIHDFSTYPDGGTPRGRLFESDDGFLYGTTEGGGANSSDRCYTYQYFGLGGCGTAFKIKLDGTGYTKLHDFYTQEDGYQSAPSTGLIQGPDGNFYGAAIRPYPQTTSSIFKMTPDGTVSVHHLLPVNGSQGTYALGGLMLASDGMMYGTMGSGGNVNDCGTVFRVGTDGSFELLHTFAATDGCKPGATLVEHSDGNLYGTTTYGGSYADPCVDYGCGAVFRISKSGQFKLLYRFSGTAADGEYPRESGLALMPDGSFYGALGGNPSGTGIYVPLCTPNSGATAFSCGTLYRIDTNGSFTLVHNFGDSNGAWGLWPQSTVLLASDGNLYGTTRGGGGWGRGTVYRYVLNGNTPIVSIDAINPSGGAADAVISLYGVGFSGATQVTLGTGTTTTSASFSVLSDERIDAVVPADAAASAFGVTTPLGTTYSPVTFSRAPVIDYLSTYSGAVRSSLIIDGDYMTTPLTITFGGGVVATDWSYVTSGVDRINVAVPRGAQTGPITVTNPGGSAMSEVFTVIKRGRSSAAAGSSNTAKLPESQQTNTADVQPGGGLAIGNPSSPARVACRKSTPAQLGGETCSDRTHPR